MNYELIKDKIETERLILLPLKPHNLSLALENYEKMQMDLGLKVSNRALDESDQYAMKVRLRKVLENIDNYLFLTNWAIILKDENKIVGFIMLKGCPNENGEVIVGYGIHEEYQRKSYATEALKALSNWVFKNPRALCIVADIERDNLPSQRVLEKAGGIKFKENDELEWWKIKKNSIF